MYPTLDHFNLEENACQFYSVCCMKIYCLVIPFECVCVCIKFLAIQTICVELRTRSFHSLHSHSHQNLFARNAHTKCNIISNYIYMKIMKHFCGLCHLLVPQNSTRSFNRRPFAHSFIVMHNAYNVWYIG